MLKRAQSLTICICTMDRPEILRRCLKSIADGSSQPDEVVVSDDSTFGDASKTVCDEFSNVRYVKGPKRGLCANRNVAIRAATSEYLALIDDDAAVSQTFVQQARQSIVEFPERVILTGAVFEYGRTIIAGNSSFLGHFTDHASGELKNVNLNCNVFPRSAFDAAEFDENIGYGYEDMDLCSRLVSLGFQIRYVALLTNEHLPPPKSTRVKTLQLKQADRARFYTSVKRYLLWERNLVKLVAFVVTAPVHRAVYAIKQKDWRDLPYCVSDMVSAIRLSVRERSHVLAKRLAV